MVTVGEVADDRRFQFGNALEDAAADAVVGDLGEEAFDEIEPGGGGRGEVQVHTPMADEPGLDVRVLVGGVVIDDEVEGEALGRLLKKLELPRL